jgi:hypothetical protein
MLDAAANGDVQFVRFEQVQEHLLLSVELSEMCVGKVAVIFREADDMNTIGPGIFRVQLIPQNPIAG